MNDSLTWLGDELALLDAKCLRRRLMTREGPQRPGTICLDGIPLVNFGSNDYLGLAAECSADTVQQAVNQTGWGSGASPLVTGRGSLHAQLERRLAEFEETEAALLFPSGFAANMGTVAALVGKQDAVLGDAKNHASIIDGCRLSGARFRTYRHCDVDSLKRRLQRSMGSRRRLIVTDALFSMDGDLAPLPQLVELAARYDAMLMVDEAHATGVFGAGGRGVCEHFGVEDAVPIRTGTFSKAIGSIGGFVVGQQRLIDWLANRARPYVFSTAPPEAVAAAALRALDVVQQEPQRRTTLLDRAADLRLRLQRQGWSTGASISQIIPVILGDSQRTMQIAAALRQQGLFVPGIRPPSVPQRESLLRISLSHAHTREMIDQLVEAMGNMLSY
jgi:8-amino-7-oxononanoate synthase